MIKTLIVDDEPLAVEILETYVNQIPQLELIGKCYNALDANKILNQQTIDLLLVDVQMPQMNGIELIKSLLNPPKFIFTTAYPEFAVEGFELNAVDYLLKPIDFNRFLKAINKIPQFQNPEDKPESKSYDKQDFIFVKSGQITSLNECFFNTSIQVFKLCSLLKTLFPLFLLFPPFHFPFFPRMILFCFSFLSRIFDFFPLN